jgi:hypothetical protein
VMCLMRSAGARSAPSIARSTVIGVITSTSTSCGRQPSPWSLRCGAYEGHAGSW